jgi:hypothetical protein
MSIQPQAPGGRVRLCPWPTSRPPGLRPVAFTPPPSFGSRIVATGSPPAVAADRATERADEVRQGEQSIFGTVKTIGEAIDQPRATAEGLRPTGSS